MIEKNDKPKFLLRRSLTAKKARLALFIHHQGRCANCDCELGQDWHADHVVPYRLSKQTNVHELAPLCPSCNLSKGGSFNEEA